MIRLQVPFKSGVISGQVEIGVVSFFIPVAGVDAASHSASGVGLGGATGIDLADMAGASALPHLVPGAAGLH